MTQPNGVLENARLEVGLSMGELWFRYFALGGMSAVLEIEAYLCGALEPPARERDLLAVALNERNRGARARARSCPWNPCPLRARHQR